MKQYDKVKVINNNYISDGVNKGDIGYIIEVYEKNFYEVEFSNETTGIDYAQTVINGSDLEEIIDDIKN